MSGRFAFLRRPNWELALLVGLLAALPILEAPKNVFWGLYAVAWIVNRARRRDFGGPWDSWDTLIFGWIASSYIIAFFAGQPNSEWDGANDVLRYASVLWMTKRSEYTPAQLSLLLRTAVGATLIALGWALWSWLGTQQNPALELNSVGHVNHSAIFLAIVFGVALSSLLASNRRNPIFLSVDIAVVIALGTGVFLSASRGAVLALLLLVLLLGFFFARRSPWIFAIALLLSSASLTIAYVTKVEVITKQQANYAADNTLSYRDAIWNTALVAWQKYPWFGVGMDNFDQVTPEQIRSWVLAQGKHYDADKYMSISHAHSLYFNTLAERGLLGSMALAVILIAWFATLARSLPTANGSDIEWTVWGSAFGAWFINAVVGLVNTTLHHEHALLSSVLFGIFLSTRKGLRRPWSRRKWGLWDLPTVERDTGVRRGDAKGLSRNFPGKV